MPRACPPTGFRLAPQTLYERMIDCVGQWPSTQLSVNAMHRAAALAAGLLRQWEAAGRPAECAAAASVLACWPDPHAVVAADPLHPARTAAAWELYGAWIALRREQVCGAADKAALRVHAEPDGLPDMSPLQLRTVEMAAGGASYAEIGRRLHIRPDLPGDWFARLARGIPGAGTARQRVVRAWCISRGEPVPAWAAENCPPSRAFPRPALASRRGPRGLVSAFESRQAVHA